MATEGVVKSSIVCWKWCFMVFCHSFLCSRWLLFTVPNVRYFLIILSEHVVTIRPNKLADGEIKQQPSTSAGVQVTVITFALILSVIRKSGRRVLQWRKCLATPWCTSP